MKTLSLVAMILLAPNFASADLSDINARKQEAEEVKDVGGGIQVVGGVLTAISVNKQINLNGVKREIREITYDANKQSDLKTLNALKKERSDLMKSRTKFGIAGLVGLGLGTRMVYVGGIEKKAAIIESDNFTQKQQRSNVGATVTGVPMEFTDAQ